MFTTTAMNVPVIDLFALYKPHTEINHQIVYDAQYLLKNYCLWQQDLASTRENLSESIIVPKSLRCRKKNKLLKTRNTQHGLKRLQIILKNTVDRNQVVVHRSAKSRHSSKSSKSTRRSRYIGVSKNGDVWQSLIMIDKKKTYIGSYLSEDDAARSYDLYALILKHLSARTNFDYTLPQIRDMVRDHHTTNT